VRIKPVLEVLKKGYCATLHDSCDNVVCQLCDVMFQDLDKKLNTLVLQSSDVSEETQECKRYGYLEVIL